MAKIIHLLNEFHYYDVAHLRKQNIIGTNLLTKFHEDRKINVASRLLTRKNNPHPGSHVFKPTGIIFELFQDIIGMNLLTKFHEDRTVNVASRVLTRKNAPPPGGHVFKATKTIFQLMQEIIRTNFLIKFHDDQKINVASRVLTRKNAPPPWWPYRTINVASRVHIIRKNAPHIDSHVFQANVTIFKLIQDINKTNLLTKYHEDWTINVTSRVITKKNAPPPGGHL
ncbi:hypothetical protein DPMN_007601 [Dreissena polymorpha]|uniref:Uncharacterized protein n=1 Tax=Dreissena polymorpha TaxID=45954 RepID=A0A9D4MW52_DREPO|nr:hypothetical protein DPMN_007601 [Dreissena polymorpha]